MLYGPDIFAARYEAWGGGGGREVHSSALSSYQASSYPYLYKTISTYDSVYF